MGIDFQIEIVFKTNLNKGPHIAAKILNKELDFEMNDIFKLGGYRVRIHGMFRVLDKEGNPRLDLYPFQLIDKKEIVNFKEGEIVILTKA